MNLKYNSLYADSVTYKSDKNFVVRLKAMIERTLRFNDVSITPEIETAINSLDDCESYLFKSKVLKETSGCFCVNVEVGSYDHQVEITALPAHMVEYKKKQGGAISICLDLCIEKEVSELWYAGITTTGCCCGHKKIDPYIGVIDEDIPRMKELGYKVAPNNLHPGREDSFFPKSITFIEESEVFDTMPFITSK